jgi:low temperature requirement protein LtrA
VVWLVAILLDAGGPALFGVQGWLLVPGHFAERHNLVIILALGESVVALGIAAGIDLTAGVITAAVLGVGIASALWWTYFDVVAIVTARRLDQAPEGRVRNALARDSYSYIHYPMVAGIILVALGLEEALHHVEDHLDAERAFALLGGTALYLLGHVALRLRNAHTLSRPRFGLAVALLLLVPVATTLPALATVALLNVPLWAMIAYETRLYGDARYRLRHGLEA